MGPPLESKLSADRPSNPRRRISRARKMLYALAVIVLFLAGLEVLFRAVPVDRLLGVKPDDPVIGRYEQFVQVHFSELDDALYDFDRDRMFRLRRSISLNAPTHLPTGGTWTITTDEHGLRKVIPTHDAGRQVLILGDSITFGFRVADEDSYPSQLQRLLDAAPSLGPVRVLNAGVPGYDSVLGRMYLDELLREFHPAVVVLAFGMNDRREKHRTRREVLADSRRSAPLVEAASHSEVFSTCRRVAAYYRERRETGAPSVRQVPLDEFEENMRAMIESARAGGAAVIVLDPFILVSSPEYANAIADLASQDGVRVVRLEPAFAARFGRKNLWEVSPTQLVSVMWEEVHPNAAGFTIIAEALSRIVTATLERP